MYNRVSYIFLGLIWIVAGVGLMFRRGNAFVGMIGLIMIGIGVLTLIYPGKNVEEKSGK